MKRQDRPADKIEPNKTLWRKPVGYYKEYVSYVSAFNAAVDRARWARRLKGEQNDDG